MFALSFSRWAHIVFPVMQPSNTVQQFSVAESLMEFVLSVSPQEKL